jgi:glycerol-3-phosphate dehydrogenase (NAD(P)+)
MSGKPARDGIPTRTIAVVGAGAWGTALAQTAARAGRHALLLARDPEVAAAIMRERRNPRHLPDVPLDLSIEASTDLALSASADAVLLAVPAQTVRETVRSLPELRGPLVICAKGLERASGLRLSEVVAGERPRQAIAVLSGPNFAQEIAAGRPAATTLAAADASLGEALAEGLSGSHFRVYWTDDVVGVEVGGAVKNVLAIAAGIVMGLELGENARAAIITRGLAELARLGEAMGARRETLAGLSGLGDAVLTCTTLTSRNTAYGQALGRGAAASELRARPGPLAEGALAAAAVVRLAERHGVDMPIARLIDDVLEGRLEVGQALERLMRRPLRAELGDHPDGAAPARV